MPASIIPDLIRDSGLERTKDFLRVVRSFWVKGIDATTPCNVIPLALSAAGIPAFGDAHPFYTTMPAVMFSVRPVGAHNMAEVMVTYELKTTNGATGEVLVEYDGGLTTEQTSVDRDGAPIIVKWYPGGIGTTFHKKQTAYVPVLRPVGQLRITKFYTLASALDTTIDDLVNGFQGHVNSASWRGRPKWAWLCSNIHVSQYSYKQYRVNFQFDWKPWINGGTISTVRGNWVADVAYLIAENGGRPPANFIKHDTQANANAYVKADVYPEKDFTTLGF